MARPGRKRKIDADRYPGGQVKPEDSPSPCVTKRLMMAALAGMADAQWGTVAGRYYLTGNIDINQYEAAKRFGSICETYTQVMLGPRNPKTSTGEPGVISSEIDPDTEVGQDEADRHIKTRQRYEEARLYLMGYNPRIETELVKFCVGPGTVPTYETMRQIKEVLTALAAMWRIDVK